MSIKSRPDIDSMSDGDVLVRRALISVSDKRGVAEFAAGLAELGVEIVSTGGTASALVEAGVEVRTIDAFTGFPEILGGRVKTLHPRVHAAILADRSVPDHVETLAENEIEPIDLVCVNLYPFAETVAKPGVTAGEAVEQIDIGGPTMIRAAAKNYSSCAVVVGPESYEAILAAMRETGGRISAQMRQELAGEAFSLTARYETAIASWFLRDEDDLPDVYAGVFEKVLDLTYGENPHQRAAYYAHARTPSHLLSSVAKLHGRELSFNNLLDLDAALRLLGEFELPACVVVKHNNPCGCAVGASVGEAYDRALKCDPMSAFGGIVCLNRVVDEELAQSLRQNFVELLYAPDYTDAAFSVLTEKESIRILRDDAVMRPEPAGELDLRRVAGGLLVQDGDTGVEMRGSMEVVTNRAPSEPEWNDLLFAWRVAKHVRSNAIVIARDLATVGLGAGQMSRIDSVNLAIAKASQSLEHSVMASDGFFPFSDGPIAAMEAGVEAIIQPGGSKRDGEVVEAADRFGAAMVFTGRRHFKH